MKTQPKPNSDSFWVGFFANSLFGVYAALLIGYGAPHLPNYGGRLLQINIIDLQDYIPIAVYYYLLIFFFAALSFSLPASWDRGKIFDWIWRNVVFRGATNFFGAGGFAFAFFTGVAAVMLASRHVLAALQVFIYGAIVYILTAPPYFLGVFLVDSLGRDRRKKFLASVFWVLSLAMLLVLFL